MSNVHSSQEIGCFVQRAKPTPEEADAAARRIDEAVRQIANGKLKPSKLDLEDLATLIVFARKE